MSRLVWLAIITGLTLPGPRLSGAESLALNPHAPRAQVVTVRDPIALVAFKPQPAAVQLMVERGLTNLTGQPTVSAALTNLLATNEIVGIKVYSAPGPDTGTRPVVVEAVVKGLLAAGFPADHIIIWDRHAADLRRAGFFSLAERLGVRAAGAAEAGYDPKTFYDTALIGNLVYGDLEFGRKEEGIGRKSYVSKLVSQDMTKIINIAPVLNHNAAGVAGNLFSLALGCVDNTTRFEGSTGRLATAVPEIYALPVLGDRVVLNISDALICQYEGEDRSLLHYSTELDEIRLSRDPVALDVLALQDLERTRKAHDQDAPPVNWDLYKNAALLELGVADLRLIDVRLLQITSQSDTTTR